MSAGWKTLDTSNNSFITELSNEDHVDNH